MQQTEKEHDESVVPATPSTEPISENLHLTPEEANKIFKLAEAEIELLMQPLMRKAIIYRWTGRLQAAFCFCLLVAGIVGTVYSAITYPHTLVVIYAKAKPEAITMTLNIPTRTLASVTITRSFTTSTTGRGHQDATAATGTVIFYNGQLESVTVANGTVFTGRDGEQIAVTQDIVIPAADPTTTPPTYGQATVPAQAEQKGASGNIPAFDINGSCCATSVIVKNLTSFHNGQDARSYKAVAKSDLSKLTSTVNEAVTQAFTTAFPVQQGEVAIPTTCHTTATPNHQIAQEATSVTVTTVKTCSAVAYASQELDRQATAAFTQTKPATPYHIVGNVQTTLKSVTPLSVTISGKWVYTFTPDYEQYLAEKIQGDTPDQARKALLRTGIIAYASIPTTLPPAMYITFLVLVG